MDAAKRPTVWSPSRACLRAAPKVLRAGPSTFGA